MFKILSVLNSIKGNTNENWKCWFGFDENILLSLIQFLLTKEIMLWMNKNSNWY